MQQSTQLILSGNKLKGHRNLPVSSPMIASNIKRLNEDSMEQN